MVLVRRVVAVAMVALAHGVVRDDESSAVAVGVDALVHRLRVLARVVEEDVAAHLTRRSEQP